MKIVQAHRIHARRRGVAMVLMLLAVLALAAMTAGLL